MMGLLAASTLAPGMLLLAAAQAQPAAVDQVEVSTVSEDEPYQPMEQVAGRGRGSESRSEAGLAPTQLNPEPRSVRAPGQLSTPAERPVTSQVFRGARTADSSEPLSRPAEGRTAATSRIEGQDRCDPETRPGLRAAAAACANVIEARSEEFRRAEAPVLSPEQRLLMEQRSREQGNASAARRLATGSVNPNSRDDQAIASVVLDSTAPAPAPSPEPEPETPSPTDSIVNAIVTRLQQGN